MATRSEINRAWNLESFLDSLIMELDKARETLAVKAINKPLTYSVKDMALELQLFPSYDGDEVKFVTAKPGESGASKVSIQLGSITDRQIRESAPSPISKDDISIDEVDELDQEDKSTLKKLGVSSIRDIENLDKRNIDLEKAGKSKIKYNKLASVIDRVRRRKLKPKVSKVSLMKAKGEDLLYLQGENLLIHPSFKPSALINDLPVKVRSAQRHSLSLSLGPNNPLRENNHFQVLLDPQTVVKFNLKNSKS